MVCTKTNPKKTIPGSDMRKASSAFMRIFPRIGPNCGLAQHLWFGKEKQRRERALVSIYGKPTKLPDFAAKAGVVL